MNLIGLVKNHRKGIIFVLSLILLENIAWIAEPTLFGNLIDAFIEKASADSLEAKVLKVLPLLLWIFAYLVNSGSGAIRRRIEANTFQLMYVELVTMIAEKSHSIKMDASKAAARAHLSKEFVVFMQYRLPEIAEQTITIIGAVIAQAFFDWRISAACLLIAFPLLLISNIYSRRVVKLQSQLHDDYEKVYDTFSSYDPEKVKKTFSSMARVQEQIAKWSAANFGIMRLVILVIFLFVLYIAIDLDNFSTGNIYSIVAYLWTFVTSVEYIPELMESAASLKDLSVRIKSDV
jgi:ABC-type multidrug transport system fused ATPase/permease subunit